MAGSRKKIIHVNKHVIVANAKRGENNPPLTVRTSDETYRTHGVTILGPSVVVHRPDKPLSCGAKVWIETRSIVNFDGVSM
jgi:hypothetical protein